MSSQQSGQNSPTNSMPTNAGTSGGSGPLKSPLLHAWHDPLANIKTNSSSMRLVDLNCDGDSKLCICDYEKKLRIYKGTNLMMEYAVLDSPIAMCITYTEQSLPRIPSIAVAAGSHVFIYRQLRPYRKWTCPPVDLSQSEIDIWNDLKLDVTTPAGAIKALSELRDTGVYLSSRSAEFLSIENEHHRQSFIAEVKDQALTQSTLITCMDVLKKDSEEYDAVSLLVIGTEGGQVLILPQDPTNSNVLCKVQLPSAPTMMSISGVFDVEWRISIVCRDGRLYSIKNGDSRGSAILVGSSIDLGCQAISIVRQEKVLWIATMDRSIACYSTRGKRLKGMILNEDIAELCNMPIKRAKISHLLLVALTNGDISIYKDLTMIHSFHVDRPILAMTFGLYGREENTLVLVHGHGSLTIKIWKRLAEVENLNFNVGPPPEQDIPLPVPKKTKLYVEQTQREREKAPEIHRGFQRDLCKLRLTTARAYVKTLTDGMMSAATVGSNDVRIQAQVQGLGPKFLLRVTLQNSGSQPLMQSRLVFSFDPEQYMMGYDELSRPSVYVPILLPGPKIVVETTILSIDSMGRAGQILCLLYTDNNNTTANGQSTTSTVAPILTAAIKMPIAEPELF